MGGDGIEKKVAEEPSSDSFEAARAELETWRDRALRLQAEMDNFRKRQRRLADERVASDRERLLRRFLDVADDLERALSAEEASLESLKQGLDLTYQTMKRVIQREDVKALDPVGDAFDPLWHEAVATVPHEQAGADPDTVIEVVRAGYRIGDRLLRPARVVVAT
jgi:molecular chaperone GrpE